MSTHATRLDALQEHIAWLGRAYADAQLTYVDARLNPATDITSIFFGYEMGWRSALLTQVRRGLFMESRAFRLAVGQAIRTHLQRRREGRAA